MAAGPFTLVNNALLRILDGTISLTGDTFRAVLVTAAHTASTADDTWSDISASEASGAGYTSEGVAVSALTVTGGAGTVTVDCPTDPSWASSTVSAKYVYLVREAGTGLAAGDLILGYMDLNVGGGNESTVGSTFSVTWSVDGLFTLARAA